MRLLERRYWECHAFTLFMVVFNSSISDIFYFFAVPKAPPLNVRLTRRGEGKLVVTWNAPNSRRWSGTATRYKICYSTQQRASRPRCLETNRLSYEITSLNPSTRYFVTVSAGTSVGFGPKSEEISIITYGGENLAWI